MDTGLIQYFGLSKERCNCGYCKSIRNSGNTYGLWAHWISPEVYQNLIDRNWRRCGKYIYKPINSEICCPMYTIRCDAVNFKLSNSQKKVIKRFNNYIKHDVKPRKNFKIEKMVIDSEISKLENISKEASIKKINIANLEPEIDIEDKKEKQLNLPSGDLSNDKNVCELNNPTENNSKLKSTKKKFLRRQKLIEKIMKREQCSEDKAKKILQDKSCAKQKTKTLEDFLSEVENFPNAKHTFKTKFYQVKAKLENLVDNADFDVFKKYQMTIHCEDESEISYRSYKRFLIDSPLNYVLMKRNSLIGNDLPKQYGAYHQHYYIDNNLVAVGVIDILPNCISSVYLFYDSSFNFLNLGVYSALNEIKLVRKYQKVLPDLKFYYLGFYIHNCPKMRYKSKYWPSDLLCSETYRWFKIDRCLEKLDKQKYSRFCDEEDVIDEDGHRVSDCDIKVYYLNKTMTFDQFKNKFLPIYSSSGNENIQNEIMEYAHLVGRRCTSSMSYYID